MFLNLLILIFFSIFLETLSFVGIFRSIIGRNNISKEIDKVPFPELYRSAQLSELAYEFDHLFKNKRNYLTKINDNNQKCPECEFIRFIRNKTNLHCLISRNDESKKIIVIFKGTSKFINWYYNLKLNQVRIGKFKNKDITIHEGFLLQLLEDDVIGKIEKTLLETPDDFDWWFCGHSAGGAHGVLSSYFFAKKYPKRKIKTFTFASPRIGNNNFAKSFDSIKNIEHWRVSYKNDLFTAVPIVGYKHAGTSIRLYPNKIYIGDYNPLFTFSLIKCHSFFDHHPSFYTKELKKYLKTF